jgi:methionyl-tRNA synthetase
MSKHEGWYSVSDETYYPESQVHLIVDPPTGRKIHASIETGKEVEWTSESNYHFRLSEFKERLLNFYDANHDWIRPRQRMRMIYDQVRNEPLNDLSISRPTERLKWGIRVPDDSSQTIYVWLDALFSYATAAGYPWAPERAQLGGWPANVQIIGKDIIRFHCIYWPAFLMALGLPLPKSILAHAHWTLGREKMSKSVGNVVNPFFALDRFGTDTMRFYLAYDGGIKDDADYSNYWIIERYKKALHGGLGNLASRIMRGKKWNVRDAIHYVLNASHLRLAENPPPATLDRGMYGRLQDMPQKVSAEMSALDISGGLKTIIDLVHETNKYMQNRSPWLLAREHQTVTYRPDMNPSEDVDICVFLCAESLRLAGILLQPFMPEKANLLLDMMGVDRERRSYVWAKVGKDDTYGKSFVELGKGTTGTLFPPLSSDL